MRIMRPKSVTTSIRECVNFTRHMPTNGMKEKVSASNNV